MKLPMPRRWWVLLLSLLVLIFPLSCAAAEQAQNSFTITAVIPGSHRLVLQLEGPGSVRIDGIAYSEDAELMLDRHSQPQITAESDLLCQLRLLTLDGQTLAQNTDGHSFTLDPLTRDLTLEARFDAAPAVVVSAVTLTGSGAVIGAALLSANAAATAAAVTTAATAATAATTTTAATGQSLGQRILAALKHRKKT